MAAVWFAKRKRRRPNTPATCPAEAAPEPPEPLAAWASLAGRGSEADEAEEGPWCRSPTEPGVAAAATEARDRREGGSVTGACPVEGKAPGRSSAYGGKRRIAIAVKPRSTGRSVAEVPEGAEGGTRISRRESVLWSRMLPPGQTPAFLHALCSPPEPLDAERTSGLLLDFLERAQAIARADGGRNRGFPGSLEQATTLEDAVKTLMVLDFHGFQRSQHRHARETFRREMLESALMSVLTEASRRSTRAEPPPQVLRRCARLVLEVKREAGAFMAMVHNWLLRDRLLNRVVREMKGSSYAEKRNQVDFWLDFHGCSPLTDGPAALLAQQRFRGSGGPIAVAANMVGAAPVPSGALQQHRPPGSAPTPDRPRPLAKSLGKCRSLPGLRSPGGAGAGKLRAPTPMSMASTAATASPMAELPSRPSSAKRLPPLTLQKSRRRYLQECDAQLHAPLQLPFACGTSTSIAVPNRDLTDRELTSVTSLLQDGRSVNEVDLSNNPLLTDRSLVPFLQKLQDEPMASTLQRLSLNKCVRASSGTIGALNALFRCTGSLQHLDLSHIPIGTKHQLSLCQVVVRQPLLESLSLADTGLNGALVGARCIRALLLVEGGSSLRSLDLSWNTLDADSFTCLGECVAASGSLRSLKIVNCSSTMQDGDTSLSHFLEQLSRDCSLTQLDVSVNRMDFRVALVMEDALQAHTKLKRIRLEDNPLGILGMRSALRLLADPRSAVMHLGTEGCFSGFDSQTKKVQTFNATNPGGKYTLDLRRPYHRSLLRMLYRTSERVKLPPAETFQALTFSEGAFSHAAKSDSGVIQVPTSGKLSFYFDIAAAIKVGVSNIEDSDFAGFLRHHLFATRVRPALKEAVPILAQWEELKGRRKEQLIFLAALSKDFGLSVSWLENLCGACPDVAEEVVIRLLPCLPCDQASLYMGLKLLRTAGRYLKIRHAILAFLEFNTDNPTGRYSLDLADCCQHAIAQRLFLLDRWESIVDKRLGRPDTSSRGNGSRLRHERFQGEPMHTFCYSVAEWALPEFGILEFDYASLQRPPCGTAAMHGDTFEALLKVLWESTCEVPSKLASLRARSSVMYLTSVQVREILGFFKTSEDRADLFVMFNTRIVDRQNGKLWRVRFERDEEVRSLQERLGYASFYPYIQPENARFELDLSYHDQRLCLSMIRGLEIKEQGDRNLYSYSYDIGGRPVSISAGVPYSWARFESVPKEGVFRATYRCAPEHRKFDARKALARTYGGLMEDVKESDVRWCTGLNDVPQDVVTLLVFLTGRYKDLEAAFRDIDGPGGNGVLSLRELEDALARLGCRHFAAGSPEEEKERISNVFRYLDSAGSGSISIQAWQVLNQLWAELDLTICELVQFFDRTFDDDLADAWEGLNEEGAGSLGEEEFVEALEDLGYFGPVRVIYRVLCPPGNSAVTEADFMELEKFKERMEGAKLGGKAS